MRVFWLKQQTGQALVTLLIFMVIVITITSASVAIILINSVSTTKYEQSQRAYEVAEAGAEDAILHMLRNPAFTGESLTVQDGTDTIQVTGTGPYTVSSVGQIGNFIRTIQVILGYTNSVLTVTSWKEI